MYTDLLKRIAAVFDRANLPYIIFGGQAVWVYGETRLTADVDMTVACDPTRAGPVLKALDDLGFRILVSNVEGFLSETFVLPALDGEIWRAQ